MDGRTRYGLVKEVARLRQEREGLGSKLQQIEQKIEVLELYTPGKSKAPTPSRYTSSRVRVAGGVSGEVIEATVREAAKAMPGGVGAPDVVRLLRGKGYTGKGYKKMGRSDGLTRRVWTQLYHLKVQGKLKSPAAGVYQVAS
jgi:hypothetical protein